MSIQTRTDRLNAETVLNYLLDRLVDRPRNEELQRQIEELQADIQAYDDRLVYAAADEAVHFYEEEARILLFTAS